MLDKTKSYKINLSIYEGEERQEISRQIQQEICRQGYRWVEGQCYPCFLNKECLYIEPDGIMYGEFKYFNEYDNIELTVELKEIEP